MKLIGIVALLMALSLPATAKKKLLGPESGTATDQQGGSEREGWAAVLIGRGVVAGPRYRHWNLVTVDAGLYRYQWEELKNNGRMVFTINEPFWFWRYGSTFLVVDVEGKTHKFGPVTARLK